MKRRNQKRAERRARHLRWYAQQRSFSVVFRVFVENFVKGCNLIAKGIAETGRLIRKYWNEMPCADCGDERQHHIGRITQPVFSNTACVYAHDSDNPCWCYKFKEKTLGQFLEEQGDPLVKGVDMGTEEEGKVVYWDPSIPTPNISIVVQKPAERIVLDEALVNELHSAHGAEDERQKT